MIPQIIIVSNSNFMLRLTNRLPVGRFGKTHDLVVRLLQEYVGKSYIILMDNFYSCPDLFYELKKMQTGAVGTLRTTRKGVPTRIHDADLKKKVIQKLCRI